MDSDTNSDVVPALLTPAITASVRGGWPSDIAERLGASVLGPMGIVDSYRNLATWRQVVYAVCILVAFALLVWDIVDQAAQYTSVGIVVLIAIAVLVRPGGVRGPRR